MVLDTLKNLWEQTGFMNLEWGNYVMVLVALVFLYLAIAKGFEPLLLVPIAFGMFLTNLPLINLDDAMYHPELFDYVGCFSAGPSPR